jgi:hypothetical protein
MFDPRGILTLKTLCHRRDYCHGRSRIEPECLAPAGDVRVGLDSDVQLADDVEHPYVGDLEIGTTVDDLGGRVFLAANLIGCHESTCDNTRRSQKVAPTDLCQR